MNSNLKLMNAVLLIAIAAACVLGAGIAPAPALAQCTVWGDDPTTDMSTWPVPDPTYVDPSWFDDGPSIGPSDVGTQLEGEMRYDRMMHPESTEPEDFGHPEREGWTFPTPSDVDPYWEPVPPWMEIDYE